MIFGGRPNISISLSSRLWHRIVSFYRKNFRNYNLVFRYDKTSNFASDIDLTFYHYYEFADIPSDIIEALNLHGESALTIDRLEIEMGGVFWLAFVDETVASVLITRYGKHYREWYVDLKNQDVIISRVRTFPEFRGRRIAPALMSHAIATLLCDGFDAYTDCRVYNSSSVHFITRAGFVRIATMKPLIRDQVLR